MTARARQRARRGAIALLCAACGLACAGDHRPYYGPAGPPFVSPLGDSLARHAAALGARTPTYRVILIGDAGKPASEDTTLGELGHWAADLPHATAVVFLGDNVYPHGLGKHDPHGEGVLLQQLRATPVKKAFVPGNHDWGGLWPEASTLAHEEQFIDAFADSPALLLPRGGCPGPAFEPLVPAGEGLAHGLQLMALDLDWWLLDAGARPACPGIAHESDFVQAVESGLRAHADDHVIVVAHHPLRSGGPHGGHGRGFLAEHALALASWFGANDQDVDGARYEQLLGQLKPALASQHPAVYASGHDHGLQVIEGRDVAGTLIVSGAGSRQQITTVTAISGTLFAHAHPGFVVLDFYGDADFGDAVEGDRAMLRVVETGHAHPVFEMELPLR